MNDINFCAGDENTEVKINPNNIGGLWIKKSKAGNDYMSGVLTINGEKTNIIVFKNANKKTDKQPDYSILKSQPFEKE